MIRFKIESKRNQMLLFAEKYGINSEKTVRCSQELDQLLNLIQLPQIRQKI
ncbi:aspartyl-phosphate phosphatase Spo0E family protein [Alkalihalobacillus trypoxylicola]|uniref:aspartyl-phosphate phosphatase Spo0E family protein n=1 Tax=Alkalihalobacillus trypoxylicola TaxID=519424 RepID=UPI0004ACFD32|nr:aspartyl-phosphate phosphatase Spo0E family protein [Alkalihalobacillus trypoxylicola]